MMKCYTFLALVVLFSFAAAAVGYERGDFFEDYKRDHVEEREKEPSLRELLNGLIDDLKERELEGYLEEYVARKAAEKKRYPCGVNFSCSENQECRTRGNTGYCFDL